MALERELKYSSPDGLVPALAELSAALAEVGAGVNELGAATQTDLYYDDEQGSVQRAGMALRVRSVHGSRLATLKSRGSVIHGVHEREELELPLPGGANEAPNWPAELQARLPGVNLAALSPRMLIITARHRFALIRGGAQVAELAFDEVTCRPAAEVALDYSIDEAAFHEVELEALAVDGRALASADELGKYGAALQDLISLYPSDITKLERATTLLAAFAE